jgi:hypothetical protein
MSPLIPGDAPPIDNPTITQEQFWYDENRRVREQALANPEIMAQTVLILSDKVAHLEDQIEWLTRQLTRQLRQKSIEA